MSPGSILIVDNFDSFTFNLFQLFCSLTKRKVEVQREDRLNPEDLGSLPAALVLSPGPGAPTDHPVSLRLLELWSKRMPVLGVCLGHQMIAHHFGARVSPSGAPFHGHVCEVFHQTLGLFRGLPNPAPFMRYHSLAVDPASLPPALTIEAHTAAGMIMALRHSTLPIFGVQFHPESFLSPHGTKLIENFLERCDA